MDKDLNRKVVELVKSGSAIGSDLVEGARLVVEALGCDAVSVYGVSANRERFELVVHSGPAIATGVVTEFDSHELERLLCSGGTVPPGLFGSLAEPTECERTSIIFPLGIPIGSVESLRGFLLLWGYNESPEGEGPEDEIQEDETGVLMAVAGAAILAALKWHDVTRHNECLRSETAKLEERVRSTEKFLYLGDMAAMLAHEIKNPLISIGGFAERLKRKITPDSPANLYLDLMTSEIKRIERIAEGAFRCMEDGHMEVDKQDLKSILTETINLFGDEFERRGIEVSTEFGSGSLPVMADREQLKIAFDNLIANAVQSMEQGGTLTLLAHEDAQGIIVEITDSGKGIDEDNLDSIFTPFFTTKDSGSGLGLPISNSIILHHQGRIEVESNNEIGTTFRIRLKCCQG